MEQLRARFPQCEFVLLSTCNRVELYAAREVHGHPRMEEIARFLADFHKLDDSQILQHSRQKTQMAVVEHLFAVAAGLDSMAVGETEILGQLREAYQFARDAGATGAALNPLFQRALRVGKAAAHAAAHGEPPSIARAAVELARREAGGFGDKTILSIGGGAVARQVLRQLRAHAPRRILVSNRDLKRAHSLAVESGADVVEFASLASRVGKCDIVLTSTASTQPILDRSHFSSTARPQLVIDLGVPRDVDATVRELPLVRLRDLDDLQADSQFHAANQSASVEAARQIVARHLADFAHWQRAREFGPAIASLYQRYHAIAEQEVERAVASASDQDEADRMRELSRRLVNKLLHDPVEALRSADSLQPGNVNYLGVMQRLFTLPADD
jgi:glutamyl-tRNA reductase